jgi:16S rRNA (cytosine967-C5)-methyltransferase
VALGRYFRQHHKLGAKDRAFIAETVFGVLRRKLFLEHLAASPTPRRLVLAYLARLAGLGLRELDPSVTRVEATWIKGVKAVATDGLPLSVRSDFPPWLLEKLQAFMNEEDILTLARSMQQPAPLDLRVNTLLAGRDEVLQALRDEGLEAAPTPFSPLGIRLAEKPALQKHPLFLGGKIEVQDEGSQLSGYLVAPRRHDMVVDFCAGAGGKSLLLGALMRSQGRLYAFDVAARRLDNLKPRLKRSGLSNLHPQLLNNENDPKVKRLHGKIDRVLVDAPCSGLGTLRRNPDLKWRQTPQSVAELTQKQAAILASAARLLKPGGRLVYVTCSLLPEENQDIVQAFLARQPEFELKNCGEILARQGIPLETGQYLQIAPHSHGTDGFFAAVMERKAPAP